MASGAPSSAMPPPEYDQQPVSGPELSGDDKTLPGSNDTDDRPHTADSKSIENQETTQREVYENDTALALVPSYSRSHVAEDPEKGPCKVEDVEETDPNVVFWDGDDDPENPYNWPTWRKIVNCALISLLTFITPLASSIFAPGVPDLMREFGSSSPLLASFVVSVYVLGFAAGPLLCAPLSEIYGRTIVYHAFNVGFFCFNIGCALAPSLSSLIVFRFFAGLFGAAPMTNGGGTIADMIRQEKRGAAMASFAIGPLLGPILGPVAGGYMSQDIGWRWAFWLVAILSGVISIVMVLFLRETYAIILLQRKVDKMRKETGNQALRSKLDSGLSPTDYFNRGIYRPLKLLTISPISIVCALYTAIGYGYLYILFTSFTTVFMKYYGFTAGTSGLSFLGMGGMKPEYRLVTLPWGAILLTIGLFWYGWSADEGRTHWIVPILGTAVAGLGNLLIFMSLQLYLVDAFSVYAASALAANTVARSLAGAFLPLAGLPMYEALGIGWGNTVLGIISAVMIPVAYAIIRYGQHLRQRFEVKNL
ncbi:Seryl-tRNA synthetase, cytoplasmic [Verticillium dahliae VDG1]|nr:Seryl-tRNA synthetase, cytoplasmic [Verticillium dahliae VDG1]